MLEDIPTVNVETDLVRLASHVHVDEFFENQRFDRSKIVEVIEFLDFHGIATEPKDLVDQAFKHKPRLAKMKSKGSRYSDGSFPVLYGSTEVQTAEAEIRHWFRKQVGDPPRARTAHYIRFTYRFRGEVKDLRPQETQWPDLTDDKGYGFCNELGAEAVAASLGGLLAPSARNKGGTNLPAFSRQTVNEISKGELVAMTYDPQTGETMLREI